jgi:acyl-CoA thioester hydrolase
MSTIFETNLRVRYAETDQMGYCYYGNYAQYLELGRVEALRSLGFRYKDLEDKGIMLPVLDFQIKYLLPAKYDDLLTVKTQITEISGTRIYFNYEIVNEENKQIAIASTTLVFVSKENMRPVKAPEEILNSINHAKK